MTEPFIPAVPAKVCPKCNTKDIVLYIYHVASDTVILEHSACGTLFEAWNFRYTNEEKTRFACDVKLNEVPLPTNRLKKWGIK